MSKVRVVYKTDGTICVIHPAPKSKRPGETEDQWLSRVFNKAIQGTELEGLESDDVDVSKLPESREDRQYWKGGKGKKITIDNVKKNNDKLVKERKEKIDVEASRIAEQSLIDKGEL